MNFSQEITPSSILIPTIRFSMRLTDSKMQASNDSKVLSHVCKHGHLSTTRSRLQWLLRLTSSFLMKTYDLCYGDKSNDEERKNNP